MLRISFQSFLFNQNLLNFLKAWDLNYKYITETTTDQSEKKIQSQNKSWGQTNLHKSSQQSNWKRLYSIKITKGNTGKDWMRIWIGTDGLSIIWIERNFLFLYNLNHLVIKMYTSLIKTIDLQIKIDINVNNVSQTYDA
jgi:hypothetical protein